MVICIEVIKERPFCLLQDQLWKLDWFRGETKQNKSSPGCSDGFTSMCLLKIIKVYIYSTQIVWCVNYISIQL